MAEISVGGAVGAGFGLIRSRPLSVLVWGVVLVGFQLLAFALFAPYYATVYGAMLQSLANGGGALPIETLQSPQVRAMQGLTQIFNLVQLLVSAVVYCAVFRAVLHPERTSWAYLRVGAPELFLVVLIFGAFIALFIGLLLLIIPTAIIVAVVAASTHAASAGAGAGVGIMVLVVMLAMIVAVIFVGLRFAFVGPMMVEDGKFHLMESWTLTRGRVGSLFLIGLSLVGIFLLIDIVLLAILIGVGVAAVQGLGGVAQLAAQMRASPAALFGKLAPFLAVYALVQIPLAGCLMAIGAAPWARAYRDLLPDAAAAFA